MIIDEILLGCILAAGALIVLALTNSLGMALGFIVLIFIINYFYLLKQKGDL